MQGVVVYEVARKADWEGDSDAELDMIVEMSKSDADFVKGYWFAKDGVGFSVQIVTDEAAAQRAAENAFIPPDASVSLVSVKAYVLEREA